MKTKKIKAIQFRLEVEKERKMMPEPASLLVRAQRFPEAPTTLCASDYGGTIHALREKGYTWGECQIWCKAQGADFSLQALHSGYRTWLRNSDEHQAQLAAQRKRLADKAEADRKRADVINILWAAGRKVASIEELDTAIARVDAAGKKAA